LSYVGAFGSARGFALAQHSASAKPQAEPKIILPRPPNRATPIMHPIASR